MIGGRTFLSSIVCFSVNQQCKEFFFVYQPFSLFFNLFCVRPTPFTFIMVYPEDAHLGQNLVSKVFNNNYMFTISK